MADLLKLEPKKGKLYLGVDDDDVDDSPQEFKWIWVKKATGLRKKERFEMHIEQGHFGNVTKIGGHYKFQEGHRSICRFNNNRFEEVTKDIIMSRDDYEDIISGREPKGGKVLVRGMEYTGNASVKKFDPQEFLVLPRYTSGQCRIMATERVEKDIEEKKVPWYDLEKNSYEYKQKWEARYIAIYEPLRKEMLLVAKNTASKRQIEDSVDLPLGILSLITRKLDEPQAEYYISRMAEYIESNPILMSNPALAYRIHQVILEELKIEHLRDLQRLYGDNINKDVETTLKVALDRHQKLVPLDLIGDGTPTEPSGRPSGSNKSASSEEEGLI